jgi:5'-deoxynucleotidase YfbR-like HD superfamily hydrolase
VNKIFFIFIFISSILNADINDTNASDLNITSFGEPFVKPECKEVYEDYQYFLKKSYEDKSLSSRWIKIADKYGNAFTDCNFVAATSPEEFKQENIDAIQQIYFTPNPLKK